MQLRWVWIVAVGVSLAACLPATTDLGSSSGGGSSSGSAGWSSSGAPPRDGSASSSGAPSSSSGAPSSSSGAPSSSSGAPSSSSGAPSSSSGAPSSSSGAPVTPTYPTAGIRRLGRAEVERAASQLLGIPAADFAAALGDDTRQAGFTRNVNERLTSVQGDALWNAAQKVASAAVAQRVSALAPCPTAGGSETCASQFIHAFLPGAFRRTTTAAEEASLLTVYRAGASGATYADGIALVLAAILQSPSFLYVTELGAPGASGATTTLTGEEIATSLALLLTGQPAEPALLTSGKAGALATADGRAQAARALLAATGSQGAAVKAQLERLVLEWIGADAVASAAKDATVFPDWYAVRADMLAESQQIVDSVLIGGDGTIGSLITTPNTFLTPALAKFYGVSGSGAVTQPQYRRGLLLAGAFVATNSYPSVTAPVKRGAMVRKRLLCQELPVPTNLGTIMVPAPDPTLTTRERFTAHSTNPACSGCHKQLDPPGFAMEIFDTAGRYRSTENGKTIQTDGELLEAGDATGPFATGADLMSKIAASKTLAQCFTRQLYRFASGRAGGAEEDTFAAFMSGRSSALGGKVIEQLIDYVQSDSFVVRRPQ